MATITVHREYGVPLARRMKVFIDDQLVGRVKSDARADFQVEPGPHIVRVALDWQRSAPVSVDASEARAITLRARMTLRSLTWKSLGSQSGRAIDLDVV